MKYCLLILLCPLAAWAKKPYDAEPIRYETSEAVDVISTYFSESKEVHSWEEYGSSGYLQAFLQAFDIPVESQVMVFSKTSLQVDNISPKSPRAIYFNEEIYIAWVPGSQQLEISVASPTTGTNFYSLLSHQGQPQLERETSTCLRCHGDEFTSGIPGHLVRSVFPDQHGQPIYTAGTHLVDQSTEIKNRWGGWFVTGDDNITHLGNKTYEANASGDITNTSQQISKRSTNNYLTQSSDIVALILLDHQVQAHNLMSKLTLQTRRALHQQKVLDELLNRTELVSATTRQRIKNAADELLSCLFFSDETNLPRIDLSASAFAATFEQRGQSDPQGRSLNQLQMETRMMKYPLSYLVYSNTFNRLPSEALDYLLPEILRILESPKSEDGYEHLSQNDKQQILQILNATHPYFTQATSGQSAQK